MKNKTKYFQVVKDNIVVAVIDFLDIRNPKYKDLAISLLAEFAKHYNIPLKRKDGLPKIKIHLREFILNDKGYMTTIINLFNSLKN